MTAIILCSRLESSRVPGKALIKYNGITHIEHLITRLVPSGYPIYLAVPEAQASKYSFLLDKFKGQLFISTGCSDDPLARTYKVAKQNGITKIIRVTHDKIFVDVNIMTSMVNQMEINKLDYVFTSSAIAGTGCEIISFNALEAAANKFKKVEHISYAIRCVTKKILNYAFMSADIDSDDSFRLLVDYPEDVAVMDIIFTTLGSDCTLQDVIRFIDANNWLRNMNKMPLVTVYTCAYNAEKWINEAMGSVAFQDRFKEFEYILIDDYSSDKTLFNMAKFCQTFKRTKFYKNSKNEGLATSSNRALNMARGKYIIRLDADDYFTGKNSISSLIEVIEDGYRDIVYPDCYTNKTKTATQSSIEHSHVGGALFRTSALNHLKFTDKMRGYDSLDIYLRAKDVLKIARTNQPTFLYRQHDGSLSKNNLEERSKIKKSLEEKHEQPGI